MVSQVSVCIDVAIERDGLDTEFGREGSYRCVPIRHGGLRQADLGLGQHELPPPFSPACPGGVQASHGPLPDQIALELCQRGEDAEDHAAR